MPPPVFGLPGRIDDSAVSNDEAQKVEPQDSHKEKIALEGAPLIQVAGPRDQPTQ
jgi:hypothetical protein